MKTFRFVTSAAFVLGATLVTLPALAETTSAAARTAADPVYVCESCKTYYTEADARKMKMLDLGGHTLVKMDSAPAGYKMASYQQGSGAQGAVATCKAATCRAAA